MPLGRVPTTSERIGSSRGLGQWGVSHTPAREIGLLGTLRKDSAGTVIEPKIKENRGRIVRVIGDGILAEFASVIDAVRCAVEVQRSMAEHNAKAPQDKRIEFRVGINFGELIIEDGDFWGDGVNIAA